MLLFDFSRETAIDAWMPISDGVMGGVSSGRLEATEHGTAAFTGHVSLDHGGGFASVRSKPQAHDLSGATGLELRVRGDGRRYKINLRCDDSSDGFLYRAVFGTHDGGWRTLRLPFADFLPTLRGRPVPQAPPLRLSAVRSVGLMISNRQAGAFRLEIASIRAYED